MRIEMYDGEVVVAYEDERENSAFVEEMRYSGLGEWLPGFINKRRIYEAEIAVLIAERCGVEVENAVYKYLDEQRRIVAEIAKAEQIKRDKQEQASRWSMRCKNGCSGCKHLRRTEFDDEYKCQATGDDLETRNNPGYYGGVHYCFNLQPFPSQNCPLNPENGLEE